MLTWKEKVEQDRLYTFKVWEWNKKTKEYDGHYVSELTLEEAKILFNKFNPTNEKIEAEIILDSNDNVEKIAMKVLLNDGVFETWDRDQI